MSDDPSLDVVFEALRDAYSFRLQQGTLIDVRRTGDEAVLMFRWGPLPDLFGVPVPLTDTRRRLDWDQPAADHPGYGSHLDRDGDGSACE